MFAKTQHLTRAQFDEYFKTGKRFHFPHLTLVYTPHASLHVSVVVGKKVAKRAVIRNLLRRRVYGVLYRTLKATDRTGVYIVVTKPAFATLSRQEAADAVMTMIARVGKTT